MRTAGADNPLHRRLALSFEELANQGWVLQRRDSSVRRAKTEAFLRRGILPAAPVVETATYIQNLAIVSDIDLITVAPRMAAEMHQSLGKVRLLEIELRRVASLAGARPRAAGCAVQPYPARRDALSVTVTADESIISIRMLRAKFSA